MKTSLIARGLLRLLVTLALFFHLATFSAAQICTTELGYARFTLEKMELTSEQPDVKHNPRKCNITIHIKGSIKNISNQTIWYLNFGTDAKPNQAFDSGLSNLTPGSTYYFDITYTYNWVNCGSATELQVLSNAADIKKGTAVCSFSNNQILPVELVSFDFDQSRRALIWETASEVNNQGFAIEYSEDGTLWTEIGFEQAANNHGLGSQYSFELGAGQINGYYRLVQVDWDGTTENSPVIRINLTQTLSGATARLYPNPARDFLYTNSPQINRIDIYNLNGQFVKSLQPEGQRVEVSDLQAGLYVAHVHLDKVTEHVKFIKG